MKIISYTSRNNAKLNTTKMKTSMLIRNLVILTFAVGSGCAQLEQTSDIKPISDELTKQTELKNSTARLQGASDVNFTVLAGTTVTNDGESMITGNLGVSPGTAITGFQQSPYNVIEGPGTVTAGLGLVSGIIYAGGAVAAQAHNAAVNEYNFLVAQQPDNIYSGVTQLDGMTFTPGVYNFAPSANLSVDGNVYLDFQGNSDAVFIFQMGSTLVTMTGSNVIALNNNDNECFGSNVYWAVGSSATIDGAQFIGTVIANTSISMVYGAAVNGRILALNGAVTMITNTISSCGTSGGGVVNPPVVCEDFVTGGGSIIGSVSDKATFGVSGGIKHGEFWGQLSYNDHDKKNGIKVKSTSVTAYINLDEYTRQIEGIAKINGAGDFAYTVVVSDKGEPGVNDTFSIVLENGYSAAGVLNGGNIQLHKKCDGKK
jgi:hypothetical protein